MPRRPDIGIQSTVFDVAAVRCIQSASSHRPNRGHRPSSYWSTLARSTSTMVNHFPASKSYTPSLPATAAEREKGTQTIELDAAAIKEGAPPAQVRLEASCSVCAVTAWQFPCFFPAALRTLPKVRCHSLLLIVDRPTFSL